MQFKKAAIYTIIVGLVYSFAWSVLTIKTKNLHEEKTRIQARP